MTFKICQQVYGLGAGTMWPQAGLRKVSPAGQGHGMLNFVG